VIAYRHADPAAKLYSFAGRTARYTLVGAICAVLNNIGGAFFGVNYVVTSFIAFARDDVRISHAYERHTLREPHPSEGSYASPRGLQPGFPLFITLMACSGLGMPVAVATPLCTVLFYVWNFALAHCDDPLSRSTTLNGGWAVHGAAPPAGAGGT
jgi:hypothetical protein